MSSAELFRIKIKAKNSIQVLLVPLINNERPPSCDPTIFSDLGLYNEAPISFPWTAAMPTRAKKA